jgi:hypothetical protein
MSAWDSSRTGKEERGIAIVSMAGQNAERRSAAFIIVGRTAPGLHHGDVVFG